jgi:hypothetical protein
MLHTSEASAQQVQDGLDRLAREPQSVDDGDLKKGLPTHGRMLHDLLPATDNLLRVLYNLPMSARQDVVRTAIVAHQQARQARADRYRLLLYSVSLILLLVVVILGLSCDGSYRTLSAERPSSMSWRASR